MCTQWHVSAKHVGTQTAQRPAHMYDTWHVARGMCVGLRVHRPLVCACTCSKWIACRTCPGSCIHLLKVACLPYVPDLNRNEPLPRQQARHLI